MVKIVFLTVLSILNILAIYDRWPGGASDAGAIHVKPLQLLNKAIHFHSFKKIHNNIYFYMNNWAI